MKGLDIAKDFFFEWGLPFLHETFPEITGRIAAGRLSGSDAIGADDEISRDHNWGPQFTLFLSAEDHAAYGGQISERMNAAAPADWHGYRVDGAGDKHVIVTSVADWFDTQLGLARPPQTSSDWMSLLERESQLYFLRHGAIWIDELGRLSSWRHTLHRWPKHPMTKRLADECFRTWHHGEYNFVSRMAIRRDPLSISICLGEFVSGVMRIILLANGDYTPYWKWLSFAFRAQPEASEYVPSLERLVRSSDIDEQVGLVNAVSKKVHRKLVTACHLTGKKSNLYLLPLLNDYYELENRLRDFEREELGGTRDRNR